MMATYIIAFVQVTDRERYGEYMKVTPGVIARHGGKFVVRGGRSETLEGPEETRRVVVIEFATVAAARAFYESAEYERARELRRGAAVASFVLEEGI